MTAGTPVAIRVEWVSEDGYIALLHNDRLPDADRHSCSLASEVATAIDYYFVKGANADEVIAGVSRADRKVRDVAACGHTGFGKAASATKPRTKCFGAAREYPSAACRSTPSCRIGSIGPRTRGARTTSIECAFRSEAARR